MTVTLRKTPRTIREVALSIAEDIAMFGHLVGHPDTALWNSNDNPTGLCCIYVNPTSHALQDADQHTLVNDFEQMLRDRIANTPNGESIVTWSNNTPTAEVIDTLRNL